MIFTGSLLETMMVLPMNFSVVVHKKGLTISTKP